MDLTQRIEKLERDNRWLKALALLAVLGFGLMFLAAKSKRIPDEIRARCFVVVDAEDSERIELKTNEGPSGASAALLVVYDTNGNPRIGLGADDESTDIALVGSAGEDEHLMLGVSDAKAGISLAAGAQVELYGGEDLRDSEFDAGLEFLDGEHERIALGFDDELNGLTFLDAGNVNRLMVVTGGDEQEEGEALWLYDHDGNPSVVLGGDNNKEQPMIEVGESLTLETLAGRSFRGLTLWENNKVVWSALGENPGDD